MSKQDKQAVPPSTFPDCEHWGKGGNYIYDPATNTRQLVKEDDQAEVKPAGQPTKNKEK